jgi:phosphoglycolate phosphatase-like HAD superfamily hydrolase
MSTPHNCALVFDFDGTLTAPGGIDFLAMRAAVGCPPDGTLLEFIAELPDVERVRANRRMVELGLEFAQASRPNIAAEDLVCELRKLGLPMAIVSRNCRAAVRAAFPNFSRISPADFAMIIGRDDGFPPKPSPAALLHIADRLDLRADQLWMIGDYCFDLDAGRAAGARTVYLTNGETPRWTADFVIESLRELPDLLRQCIL